jgi:hypothetical protein
LTGFPARTAAAGGDNRAFFTKRTMPTSGNWTAVGWNGSVWAALVGGSTQAATSPDGITWTSRTSSGSSSWNGMGNVGSTFISVGSSSSTAQTSTDGINWTSRTMPSSQPWALTHYSGVAAPGVVAYTTNAAGKAAYSTNGVTWTESSFPRAWQMGGMAYNGSMWCAIVDNFSRWYFTSTNGTTWTERSLPMPNQRREEGWYQSGPWWTGTYWIWCYGYGETYFRSTDAINWERCPAPKWMAPDNRLAITPQYNPGIGNGSQHLNFSVYRGGAATTDGVTWKLRQVALPYSYGWWYACAYSPTTIVYVGQNGICVSGPATSPATR